MNVEIYGVGGLFVAPGKFLEKVFGRSPPLPPSPQRQRVAICFQMSRSIVGYSPPLKEGTNHQPEGFLSAEVRNEFFLRFSLPKVS